MKRMVSAVIVACFLVLLIGCVANDPVQSVLKERRVWKVDLLSFLVRDDGKVSANFRLTGPVSNNLETLTVRIEQLDATGKVLAVSWNAFNISEVRRGGPVEKYLLLDPPAGGGEVESLRVDPMVQPDPSDMEHIQELQGLETVK